MANEEKPQEIITVTDFSSLGEDISSLYLKEKFSDVSLILDGQKIFAHKAILSVRCRYFDSLLAANSNETEIVITDVPVRAFRKLLKYIYTGSVTLELSDTNLIFDVMQLASRYSIRNLELELSHKISNVINMDNVFDILNKANMFDMEGLRNVCHSFMDEYTTEVLQNVQLLNLTQKSMSKLLERDSFLAPEIEIFEAVAKWCQTNKDNNNSVIETVRLNCLTTEELVKIVGPSKLIESEKLFNVLAEEFDGVPESANLRLLSVKDENLVTREYKAEVISGLNTGFLLDGNENRDTYAYHSINDKNGITVKLKVRSYVNHISMKLCDQDTRYYSYYIETSLDQKKWRKIIDYTHCHCRSIQSLFFEKVLSQYIRIVGTCSSANSEFQLTFLKIYFKSITPKMKDGMVYPGENVATFEKGALIIEGQDRDFLIRDEDGKWASHHIGKQSIVVQLAQPYIISNLKLRLPGVGTVNRYFIETSLNKVIWKIAVDHRDKTCCTWQNLSFEERPVVYIKISGTHYINTGKSDGDGPPTCYSFFVLVKKEKRKIFQKKTTTIYESNEEVEEDICAGCLENYNETVTNDEWFRCVIGDSWLHENCSEYDNVFENRFFYF